VSNSKVSAGATGKWVTEHACRYPVRYKLLVLMLGSMAPAAGRYCFH
jgi:hypothetical protein